MAFVISASLGIILFASLFLTERKLSLFEMIIIWSFLQLVQNQYFWDLSLNIKVLRIAGDAERYIAFLFNHSIIVPVLSFYCLELALSVRSKWLKLIAILLNFALFCLCEYLCKVSKIVVPKPGFVMGYSMLFWAGIAVLLYVMVIWMRRIAAKDVNR
jgi:hypothetical protein